ncbi:MAG: HDIG domain-containing protein, partial [Bacteroidales bacterium]|nr:HDIG domain-containing protein [Bacteroidales bacterium]
FIDLQHPIMRDLLVKAPGTYQHTMIVASLAQAVGDAIGADTLLLRVGAYYHDIGKIQKSNLYVENQLGGQNDHDEMDPMESARFIIGHVEKGAEVGRTIGLPEVVIDLISQHHGTQLVEYFYEKAKARQSSLLHNATYRYPGPKPRSVEAVILMIVDAAEAASRTVREPTRERIEQIVRVIIEKRIADGQFDKCDIRTRDLGTIVETLVDALVASSHSRVMYPWQEEKKVDFEFEELDL